MADFNASNTAKEVIDAYIHDVSALAYRQEDVYATNYIVAKRRQNLRDGLFLILTRYFIGQDEKMHPDWDYKEIDNALHVFLLYSDGKLN